MSREAVVIGSGAAGSARRGSWPVRAGTSPSSSAAATCDRASASAPAATSARPTAATRSRACAASASPTRCSSRTRPGPRPRPADGVARSAQGALGQLGAAVGGTTLHYNAKTPALLEAGLHPALRPGPGRGRAGRRLADPLRRPRAVLRRGRAAGRRPGRPLGDARRTLQQSPRKRRLRRCRRTRPATPPRCLAEGARAHRLGALSPTRPRSTRETRDGRPACNSCGLCSGFGCPINARGDALVSFLNPAVRTGRVRVIDRACVHRIETTRDGRRARAVHWRDVDGREHRLAASTVILAGSPINTARLLLLSASGAHPDGLGNRSDQVGRNMMFHNFTLMRRCVRPRTSTRCAPSRRRCRSTTWWARSPAPRSARSACRTS